MHISVYCDKMGKGRISLPLCCSAMPVNTFVLGNNSASFLTCSSIKYYICENIHKYKLVALGKISN